MTDPVPFELSGQPQVIGTTPEEVVLEPIIDPDFLPVGGNVTALFEVEDPPDEGEPLNAAVEQEERDLLEQQYLASGQSLK